MSLPDKAMKLKDGKIIADQLSSMVAVQFATDVANEAESYVVYNGSVYYLPNGHTAGTSWVNTEKEGPTNIGGELTQLKSAINSNKDRIDAIEDCFVKATGESVTLTNADSISNVVAGNGMSRAGNSSDIPRVFKTVNGSEISPNFRHNSMNLGNHKWLVSFKWKMTKLVETVGSPSTFRIFFNYSKYFDKTPVFDEWVRFLEIETTDLDMLYCQMKNFATAPQKDEFQIEIKDYYVYNLDGVSNDLITVIENSQDINFQDGTVTYTTGSGGDGLLPDTTLKESGKTADSKAVGDAIGIPTIVDIPFSVDNSYIDSSGAVQSATGYNATDFFDVTGADAIAFTGKMGSSKTVFWYDSSKTFISGMLAPSEKMIWFYNILTLKPATAKYVRLVSKKTSASNPPTIAPVATAYYGKKYIDYLMQDIVGDGVTDDTLAVQKVVNMANSVKFPAVEKILLSSSISIALGYTKLIDGNGVTLIASGDFYALTVEGTLNSSASPSSITDAVLKVEGGMLIENFKITSASGVQGGGIDASKAFNLKIENNYIYRCANGIRFSGMNRDVVISQNHIFALTEDGILFDTNVNLHQCNINNNMVMFALNAIHIHNPSAIANFQITGNDLEIVNYPSTGYESAKCIFFDNVDASQAPGMFGEIEICGNTIQSHDTSVDLIVMSGHADMPISDVSITGNHISNSGGRAILLENCLNVAISGNNYNSIRLYVYELKGECENIIIVADTARGVNATTQNPGGKVHAPSTAVLTNVKCKNVLCTPNGSNSIETSDVTDVDLD